MQQYGDDRDMSPHQPILVACRRRDQDERPVSGSESTIEDARRIMSTYAHRITTPNTATAMLSQPPPIEEINTDGMETGEIYEKARDIAVDCNKSLHNSLRLVAASREIGARTLHEVQAQTQQMDSIHNTVQNIDNDVQYSERKARGIRSLWGAIWNALTSGWHTVARQRNRSERTKKQVELNKQLAKNEPVDPIPLTQEDFHIMLTYKPAEQLITGEQEEAEKEFYKLTNENDAILNDINENLVHLKRMAVDIGTEYSHQNNKAGTITSDIQTTGQRMGGMNKTVKQML